MPSTPTGPTSDLLTVREAAETAHLSTKTIHRTIAAGELPTIRIGRKVLIPREHLTAWLHAHSRPATSGPLAGRGA
ncbi:helix-turn-helix domain-containing protein [Demequina gelatinilytica]|uniref:helix-turn-helix domain-containing protein n=1 Tax=Demequina gelatinilytica TaxID=1638980 RepID=UPI00078353CE|nr:helix-turn-helix domain-containing protein [Demequina gelatinilytica]